MWYMIKCIAAQNGEIWCCLWLKVRNFVCIADQVSELRQRQTQELKQVQLRVQTAVAAKDETIAALREHLSQTLEQLKSTEAVLQEQQAELC